MAESKSKVPSRPRAIHLYDHLPGILAGYPALVFLILAGLSLPEELEWSRKPIGAEAIFWIALVCTIIWYIAFRFNLPKRRFWLVFGLAGTFVGIPLVLEITGYIRPFAWSGEALGRLAPRASSGAYFVGSMVFGIVWIANLIWSRTHLHVRIEETGLTIKRVGGKGERFDLIGLKTEDEPLDYLETFVAGIGTLSLKTRMNKPIFTMKRVVGLYRVPWMPWKKGKLARIEEMLSYQGKVLAIDPSERADLADAADAAGDEDDLLGEGENEIDAQVDGEFHDDRDGIETADSPDIK